MPAAVAGDPVHLAATAVSFAREIGLPEEQVSETCVAAIVRDAGQLKVPANILFWPDPRGEFEPRLMRRHC
jgi:HD-GYP domain-containing protein (c-di-GMP phosphodiesterase class II)